MSPKIANRKQISSMRAANGYISVFPSSQQEVSHVSCSFLSLRGKVAAETVNRSLPQVDIGNSWRRMAVSRSIMAGILSLVDSTWEMGNSCE